jgi:hypothetical protein
MCRRARSDVSIAAGRGGGEHDDLELLGSDGDPNACEAAVPSAAAPLAQCSGLVRLEFSPVSSTSGSS